MVVQLPDKALKLSVPKTIISSVS